MAKKLVINLQPYRKLLYYTQSARGEVSGLGRVRIADNTITVLDVKLFKQVCSAGGTELNGGMMAEFLCKVAMKGKNIEDYKLWWHSHNDFGVFFSGTDTATIAELSADATLVSLCINKSGEIVARVDTRGESEVLQTIVMPTHSGILRGICKREVKRKVTEEVITFEPLETIEHSEPISIKKDPYYIDWGRFYRKRYSHYPD